MHGRHLLFHCLMLLHTQISELNSRKRPGWHYLHFYPLALSVSLTNKGSLPPQGLLSAASPAWNTFPPEPHTSDSISHFGFKPNVACPESSSLTPLSGGQKLQPMGQTHPTSLFGQASAWFSHFLMAEGKSKEGYFVTLENYMKFTCQCL